MHGCRWLDVGLGLKPEHFDEAGATQAPGLWFEVHPENYMMEGGPRLSGLKAIARNHPISLHGVGASLGGLEPPDTEHLRRVAGLVERFNPVLVSEHATWSSYQGAYYADLLPLPRTAEIMANLVRGVTAYQEAIGRPILLENPSNYLPLSSEMDEVNFLMDVARASGCGILLDVNNLYVSANNTGLDPYAYIRALRPALVGEIHIAGHSVDPNLGETLLIDSHDSPVVSGVWQLLEFALAHLGHKPVLLERDAQIPPFADLMQEVIQARRITSNWGNNRVNA